MKLGLTALVLSACLSQPAPEAEPTGLHDRAEEAGLRFRHHNGRSGRKFLLETLGAGVAIFDADDDGWPDVYCVDGAALPGAHYEGTPRNALFRNRADGSFEDVSAASGAADTGYGFGCCVGDYDADGRLDLYVTNFGANRLFRNLGDCRFEDVTEIAGVGGTEWSTGAAFLDADGDGDLDLYVANYVRYDIDAPKHGCRRGEVVAYCHPRRYRSADDVLYRNDGDGTFTDVSRAAGLLQKAGKGLGVVCGDWDADGDSDIFVANDQTPNFLLENRTAQVATGTTPSLRFQEIGLLAGVACGEDGDEQSGMGLALVDYDNDGWLDFAVTNFTRESNSLYRNQKGQFFTEESFTSGTGKVSFALMGWGTGFHDFDHDGRRDWFVANGHLQTNLSELEPTIQREQRHLLFRNLGGGRFADLGERAGPALAKPGVGRGAAFGDIDNDGDIDVLLSNENDTLRYLRQERKNTGSWLSIDLRQADGPNRFAIGARVTLRAGEATEVQIAEVQSGGSYLSQNDLRLHFGLGPHPVVDSIQVRWPDGSVETRKRVAANRLLRWTRGEE